MEIPCFCPNSPNYQLLLPSRYREHIFSLPSMPPPQEFYTTQEVYTKLGIVSFFVLFSGVSLNGKQLKKPLWI